MTKYSDGDTTTIRAPFAGVLRALDSVPDQAFSGKLVGDGLAIDPLDSVVRAPFDGVVIAIAPTGHSITVRSVGGLELLIHIGIDTVTLKHEGFDVRVSEGQEVSLGDELILLDLDKIATFARDCVSPVIIVSEFSGLTLRRCDGVVAAGEVIMTARGVKPPMFLNGPGEPTSAHIRVRIALPHGLHARPAARIAALTKELGGELSISFGEKSASSTSTTAIMRLGVSFGDEIDIRASGSDAREAVVRLSRLLDDMAQTEGAATTSTVGNDDSATKPKRLEFSQRSGVRGAPGIGVGPVAHLMSFDLDVPQFGRGEECELAVLHEAVARIQANLTSPISSANPAALQIRHAHLSILEDQELLQGVQQKIAEGFSAPAAWRAASRTLEESLAGAGNKHLHERAIDLRNIERCVVADILGEPGHSLIDQFEPGAVLVCDELEPSFLIDHPNLEVSAICSAKGGATSHAAILAAASGIPMLVSLGDEILGLPEGCVIIVDADNAMIDISPSQTGIADANARMTAQREADDNARVFASTDCVLADGSRIDIFANLASAADAAAAVANGAEGCGLLRTEFLFSDSSVPPSEAVQIASYQAIAQALQGRPFIIRTLDAGGDKPLPYCRFDAEANPALGLRGIRFLLREPTLLRTQLRAMLLGVPVEQLRVMLPMIVDVTELRIVREMFDELRQELSIATPVPLGIMVETPAAALLSVQLGAEADFFSIGSNDLSQYVLAMDRGNASLAGRIDACHPAVLHAIAQIAEGARRNGCPMGICGGLASEAVAAPLLVGLGCDELSAVPGAIPAIKQILRKWTISECRDLARDALGLTTTEAVRQLLDEASK